MVKSKLVVSQTKKKTWGKCWHATHEERYSLSEWEVNLIYFPGWMCSNTFKKKKKLRFPGSCHCTHHILASQLETLRLAASPSQQLQVSAPVSIAPSTELLTFPGKLTTLSTWKKHEGGLSTDQVELMFFHLKKTEFAADCFTESTLRIFLSGAILWKGLSNTKTSFLPMDVDHEL